MRVMIPVLALTATALAVPASAEDLQVGTVVFEPCSLSAPGDVRVFSAYCARHAVPEDATRPDGRSIELALTWLPAESVEAQPDPIVLLAGGPGQAAREAYAGASVQAAFGRLNRQRPVLLIDQRGTGDSRPLPCRMPDVEDAERYDSPQALRELAQGCVAALSTDAALQHYTTVDAVQDLETLRQALGSPLYNLVGGSYGTRVALDYLRRHPEGVRSVVLDGVVPPELALGQDHAANLEAAVARIFAHCRQDSHCAERFGDPAETLAKLRQRLREAAPTVTLNDPYSNAPITATLSESLLAAVMRFYAYVPEFATLLPLLLDETETGHLQPLVAQGELLFRRADEQMMHGMELSVMCSEEAGRLHARPQDEGSLLGNAVPELVQAQCAVWPQKPVPEDFHQPVHSDKPVLLLSGAWDPVTPPRYAEQVAQTLPNSRQLVAPGRGHIVMGAGCAPRLLETFVETLAPAELDAQCLQVLRPPPFFTSFYGPEP